MTLRIAKPTGAALRLAKPTGASVRLKATWAPADPDAAAYITAVQAADGQALEQPVALAIDNFVLGCKADGIWPAIKASCILAGARTLSGALVPLVGTAPTNFNFVSGDYNRKTGLVGDGSTKYLNSNSNRHLAVYRTTSESRSASRAAIGFGINASAGACHLLTSTTARFYRMGVDYSLADGSTTVGFWAASRTSDTVMTMRYASISTLVTTSAAPPASTEDIYVFNRSPSASIPTDARLAFYSIGESLDLALLDARVTALVAAFAAAIP